MRTIFLSIIFIAFVLVAVSCRKKTSALDEYRTLVDQSMEGYQSSDIAVAEKALLQYRESIGLPRFAKLTYTPQALIPCEMRLVVLNEFKGDSNQASFWFASYQTNLNMSRRSHGLPDYQPTREEVRAIVDKLDAKLSVRWRNGNSNSSIANSLGK